MYHRMTAILMPWAICLLAAIAPLTAIGFVVPHAPLPGWVSTGTDRPHPSRAALFFSSEEDGDGGALSSDDAASPVVKQEQARQGAKSVSRNRRNSAREEGSRRSVAPLMEFMEKEMPEEAMVGDAASGDDDRELMEFVETIVRAADMRKAEDIVAVRIDGVTSIASYMVLVSGTSRPQNQAIASAISNSVVETHDRRTLSGVPEGSAESGWILLDYGDIVVHVMTPKSRLFYDLEGRWSKGVPVDVGRMLVPNNAVDAAETDGFGGTAAAVVVEEEEDPFWS